MVAGTPIVVVINVKDEIFKTLRMGYIQSIISY